MENEGVLSFTKKLFSFHIERRKKEDICFHALTFVANVIVAGAHLEKISAVSVIRILAVEFFSACVVALTFRTIGFIAGLCVAVAGDQGPQHNLFRNQNLDSLSLYFGIKT